MVLIQFLLEHMVTETYDECIIWSAAAGYIWDADEWVQKHCLPLKDQLSVKICLGTSYWTRNVTLYSLCCAVGHIRPSISMFFFIISTSRNGVQTEAGSPWKAIVGVSKSTPQIEGLLSTSCSHLQDLDAFSWHTIHKVFHPLGASGLHGHS